MKTTRPTPHSLSTPVLLAGLLVTLVSLASSFATVPAGTWYKIRTNGVPQTPTALAQGASGNLWMTSESTNETGAYRVSAGNTITYFTGDARENDLGRSMNLTEKAPLAGQDVMFATDDAAGNTWYALAFGGVKVQKQDGTWVEFNTSQAAPRKLANDQMARIRRLPGGNTLLIGPLGAYVVNSSLNITQERTGIFYNNDFVNDAMLDSAGRWWVLTNRGPHRGTSLAAAAHVSTLYAGANVPATETPMTRIEEDVNGHIWMVGSGTVFCLNASNTWETYASTMTGLGTASGYDLVPVPNGDVWFAMPYGVTRYRRSAGTWAAKTLTSMSVDSYSATSIGWDGSHVWFTSGYNPSVTGNGTGVHRLTLDGGGDYTSHDSYTYLNTSTTVPSNRCRAVAADKSGNVWFGAYDQTIIARHKADGTWDRFTNTAGPFTMNFGIVAIGVDSTNKVYFLTYNAQPFAYDATTDTWITLPTPSSGSFGYPYGLYIDEKDGKWFHNSDGVMHLDATNTTWTYYGPGSPGLPSQYVDYGVRLDRYGNAFFGTRGGLSMHKADGSWANFTPTDGSGYGYPSDGTPYKAILDDNGEVWSQGGLKLDYQAMKWSTPADTTLWANRNLPFANGRVFLGADPMRARGVIVNMTGSPVTRMDEDLMTVDTHGTVYQGQWMFSADLGVLAYEQPADSLTIDPGSRTHTAPASSGNVINVTASRAWTATTTDSWITIVTGATGGGTGSVTYALTTNANATSAARNGTITISSLGGIVRTFSITQNGMALAPAGELLTNPEFDTAAGANWNINAAASRATMFATSGVADMHVSGVTGKLLWQDLNVTNVAGMAFRVGATLHSGAFPAGKSVAVYLDYLDGTGATKRLLVLDPENRDIAGAPSSSYFENQITMPADAQTLTGFSVDRLGFGEFTAESFTLTTLGYAIPIYTLGQLQAIGMSTDYPMSGNYLLMNDINASSTQFLDEGKGFAPIGGTAATAVPFTGSFDGQDFAIHYLAINRPTLNAVGFFRTLASRAVVRRLALKGGSVSGGEDVGAIVGMSDNSTVLRCYAGTYVSSLNNAGGVVGANHGGTVQECFSDGDIMGLLPTSGTAGACGSMVGFNMGTIRDCIGGGKVFAISHYSAGGLVGTNLAQGLILRSYAAGGVGGNMTTNVGGLVGDAMDTSFVQTSFWDTQTTGQAASDGGMGTTTALMMQQDTFTAASWDFTSVWFITNGTTYPYLRALAAQLSPPLMITQDPVNVSAPLGSNAQFTVVTTGGNGAVTYRWQKNQSDLTEGGHFTGTNTATLTINTLVAGDDGTKYRCIVTDTLPVSVTSAEATLGVIPAPTAVTNASTANFATRATLAGEVNGFGASTTVEFLWGLSPTALTNMVTAVPSPITTAGTTVVTAEITGLSGAKKYYYRVSAVSAAGTTLGTILNFTTPAASPPSVVTQAATSVTFNTAILHGTVNPKNSVTTPTFDYGTTTAFGQVQPAEPMIISGATTTNAMGFLMGLQPHTKYYFRIVGSSDNGTAVGSTLTFTTANRAPTAVADAFTALPLSPVVLPVLGNDTDPDGDGLTITSFTQPVTTAGTVAKVGQALLFTPKATFTGGTFNYTMSDGFGGTSSSTVTLTVGGASLDLPGKTVASLGETYSVNITTMQTWAVSEAASWITCTPTSGTGNGTVNITVLSNTAKTTRSADLFIGGQKHTVTQTGVQAPQLTVPATIPKGIVSGSYSLPIPTVNGPVTYVVTGLPKGLSITQSTGVIEGKPQVYGDFNVTVKASNAAGSATPISFAMQVLAMPVTARGTFTALVPRDAAFTDSMGGFLSIKVTNVGVLTGTLKLGGTSINLPSSQLEVPLSGSPTAHIVITRKGLSSYVLDLKLNDGAAGYMTCTLDEGISGGAHTTFDGWRIPWSNDAPAGAYAGRYTVAMVHTSLIDTEPQGTSYAAVTSDVVGNVSLAGKLADGSVFTTSTTLWPTGGAPVFQTMTAGKGSVHGAPIVNPTTRTVGGTVSWSKKPQPGRAYAAGFAAIDLNVVGEAYTAPDDGEPAMGLPDVAFGQTNARIAFSRAGIESAAQFASLDQLLRFTAAGTVTSATNALINPAGVKITSINKTTGVFVGTMTLSDSAITRLVPFEGVLMNASHQGYGFFLLPNLPTPPATGTTTTPQKSGQVFLDEADM